MYDKYEIKTYPEYFQMDDSDTDTEKVKSTLKMKKATYVNPKRFSDEVFQPECIFTKEKNNISFYQSDSNESFKNKKYKSLSRENNNKNYDSDFINRKVSRSPDNFVEEQFSYNYTTTEENNNNKKDNNIPLNQRICLNNYFHQKSNQVPKRTIKSYQNQFDVEKSDNFNVLSYRPEDYESDNIKTDSKSKIIQIFKKQEGVELFYPSKRAQSPPSPQEPNNTLDKKEKLLSYQTPTLKFQSFFGSYTRPKHIKNSSQGKSTSKIKKNQLEDFNIDKLIEIGDNSKKWKNILSFGKKINNIKKKNKNNLNYNSENERFRKKTHNMQNLEENSLKPENLSMIIPIPQKKKIIEGNINHNNNKNKIMTKKIVYHGQIKRKRNINNKTLDNQNKDIKDIKDINNQNNISENMDNPFIINNEKKEIYNINNNNQTYINNMHNNNKANNNNSNSIKFKKINSKLNMKNKEAFYNKNKPNPAYQQIIPKKTIPKKKIDINKNDNQNYSTNNNHKNNKILEKKKYITMKNMENNIQNELSTKVLLTEEDNTLPNKNVVQPIKPTIKKASINTNNAEENSNIKYNKNNTGTNNTKSNNQNDKKYTYKEFKIKNYYGYDERHNLEGPINNHSYYVSVYSRKKVNQKNNSNEKIN
jgi:hypothetical protein